MALGGSVGRGHDSFLIQSSLHHDGHGYRMFLMASMVDCFTELFQFMGAPAQGPPLRMHTFDLCLQSAGRMHQWDVILKRGFSSLLWFPSWLDGMRALVSFFRLSTLVSQQCMHLREDVQLPVRAEMIEQVRVPSIAEWCWGTLHTAVDAFAGVLPTLSTHISTRIYSRTPGVPLQLPGARVPYIRLLGRGNFNLCCGLRGERRTVSLRFTRVQQQCITPGHCSVATEKSGIVRSAGFPAECEWIGDGPSAPHTSHVFRHSFGSSCRGLYMEDSEGPSEPHTSHEFNCLNGSSRHRRCPEDQESQIRTCEKNFC